MLGWGLLWILPWYLSFRYQPDQILSKREKAEEGNEISDHEASLSEPVPEAGPLMILKSLWFPTSTTPTQISGQIVYGCVSLLGEQWDFSLVIFWNWQDRLGFCVFGSWGGVLEIQWPFLRWAAWGGVWPKVLTSLFLGPACSPPRPLQFSCWASWAWSWPSGPDVCSLETPCSQQWLCCCCCSSLGWRLSSGGSPRTPVLLYSG